MVIPARDLKNDGSDPRTPASPEDASGVPPEATLSDDAHRDRLDALFSRQDAPEKTAPAPDDSKAFEALFIDEQEDLDALLATIIHEDDSETPETSKSLDPGTEPPLPASDDTLPGRDRAAMDLDALFDAASGSWSALSGPGTDTSKDKDPLDGADEFPEDEFLDEEYYDFALDLLDAFPGREPEETEAFDASSEEEETEAEEEAAPFDPRLEALFADTAAPPPPPDAKPEDPPGNGPDAGSETGSGEEDLSDLDFYAHFDEIDPEPEPETAEPAPEQETARSSRAERRSRRVTKNELIPVSPPAGTVPARTSGQSRAVAEPASDLDRILNRTMPSKRRRWRARLVWLVILGILAWVAFLPYQMEVGGDFTVRPAAFGQARARTDGEIIEVSVARGDWVEKGEVMAVLSNWDERREIAAREAEIATLEAELQSLLDGARPDEIRLKEQALAATELRVNSAKTDLDRYEQLAKSGAVSQSALDEKRDTLSIAESDRETAKIELDLIRSGARESEITAAKAELDGNRQELEFARFELEQTRIRAPVMGQVVSDLYDVPVGAFLPEGGLFADLEDNRVMFAEIEVPETMIEEVQPGLEVTLRLWSDSDAEISGTVDRIAPKAEEREYGKVIKVTVRVPNENGQLSSEMTGYAKVAVGERPVWEAFSRTIIQFFEIELWSWLP